MEKIWMLIKLPYHPIHGVYKTKEEAQKAAIKFTKIGMKQQLYGVMELVGHTQNADVPVEFKDV